MKNNVLDIKKKIVEKAVEEWALSIQTMSPEDICIKLEEMREESEKSETPEE